MNLILFYTLKYLNRLLIRKLYNLLFNFRSTLEEQEAHIEQLEQKLDKVRLDVG